MNPSDILTIKKRHLNLPIKVTTSDNFKFYDGIPGNVLIMDQNNELVHALRYVNSQYVTKQCEMEVVTFSYSMIDNITTTLSKEQAKQVLDVFVQDGLITDDDKPKIIDMLFVD